MVAMFAERLFKQFSEFSGYARYITAEWWIEPYNVLRSISPWLRLMFVLFELDFLLISTVF